MDVPVRWQGCFASGSVGVKAESVAGHVQSFSAKRIARHINSRLIDLPHDH
jgi:hypothetical protein